MNNRLFRSAGFAQADARALAPLHGRARVRTHPRGLAGRPHRELTSVAAPLAIGAAAAHQRRRLPAALFALLGLFAVLLVLLIGVVGAIFGLQPVQRGYGPSAAARAETRRSFCGSTRPPARATGSTRGSSAPPLATCTAGARHLPASARPQRVQAAQKGPSARTSATWRQGGESQHPCGKAPPSPRCANAPVSPVTREVAGSSPVAPAPSPGPAATGLPRFTTFSLRRRWPTGPRGHSAALDAVSGRGETGPIWARERP